MNSRYEWVAFDFDGTLVDSLSIMFDVYYKFMKLHDLNPTIKEFEKLNGSTLDEIIVYLKTKYKLCEDNDRLLQQYEEMINSDYMKDVKLFEGRKKLLDYLKNKEYRIGLVTSAKKNLIDLYLKNHKLNSYFDLIIYGNNIKHSKPHPEIYRIFASKIKDPTRAVVLEDSENGIKSAKKAGLKVFNIENKKPTEIIKLIERK